MMIFDAVFILFVSVICLICGLLTIASAMNNYGE